MHSFWGGAHYYIYINIYSHIYANIYHLCIYKSKKKSTNILSQLFNSTFEKRSWCMAMTRAWYYLPMLLASRWEAGSDHQDDDIFRIGNLGNPMTDPWDNWYIYLHEWLNNYGINVGKYTSPMDPMGYIYKPLFATIASWEKLATPDKFHLVCSSFSLFGGDMLYN